MGKICEFINDDSIISYDYYLFCFWHPPKFKVFIDANSHFLALFCGLALVYRLDANLNSSGPKLHRIYLPIFEGVDEILREGNKLTN